MTLTQPRSAALYDLELPSDEATEINIEYLKQSSADKCEQPQITQGKFQHQQQFDLQQQLDLHEQHGSEQPPYKENPVDKWSEQTDLEEKVSKPLQIQPKWEENNSEKQLIEEQPELELSQKQSEVQEHKEELHVSENEQYQLQPISDQLQSGQLISDELESDQPISDQIETSEPISHQLQFDQPISDQLQFDQLISDQLEPNQPNSDQLESDQPISNKLQSNKPISAQLESDQPISEQLQSFLPFGNECQLESDQLVEEQRLAPLQHELRHEESIQKQSKQCPEQPQQSLPRQVVKQELFVHPLSEELQRINIADEKMSETSRINKACSNHSPSSSASSSQPVVPTSLDLPSVSPPRRRKIIPSRDLLHDCEIEAAIQRVRYNPGTGTAASNLYGYKACRMKEDITGSSSRSSCEEEDDAAEWEEESWSECEKTPQSLNTPDYFNSDVFDGQLDWNDTSGSHTDDASPAHDRSGSPSSRREEEENKRWRSVEIGDRIHRIDLKVVEPYKRILSHGGYYGDGFNTIVVLTACYLPDKRRRDYHYVMRNLFLYVLSTLELLVMDEYTVVYFHGSVSRQRMPSFRWLKHCYQMIDRKFKKNLKRLLIVHPTFFLRTVMVMSKPFISSKFYAKLRYVRSLEELCQLIPMDHVHISDEIKAYDAVKNGTNSINTV